MSVPQFTPEIITHLEPNEIFVFGSNLNGAHMGGAARMAHSRFGAIWGKGEGLMGRSYAFPTLDQQMQRVAQGAFRESFRLFLHCVMEHPQLTFYLTKIGCGIAGWKESEVRQMLWETWAAMQNPKQPNTEANTLPSNLIIPREFS